MRLDDFLARMSYGELSNLAIGTNGKGKIVAEQIPKVVNYLNEGLLRIYSRFVLLNKQILIEQVNSVTNYHLIPKFAESSGSDAEFQYIKDLPDEKFTGDVIRITAVVDYSGWEYPLNDPDHPLSLFTPAPQILQIPFPKTGVPLTVQYQARHVLIGPTDMDQDITVPFVLEGALQSFCAYKVFSHMNGQDNQAKSQEHLNTYDGVCTDVEAKDLVNTTYSATHHKLQERGFV